MSRVSKNLADRAIVIGLFAASFVILSLAVSLLAAAVTCALLLLAGLIFLKSRGSLHLGLSRFLGWSVSGSPAAVTGAVGISASVALLLFFGCRSAPAPVASAFIPAASSKDSAPEIDSVASVRTPPDVADVQQPSATTDHGAAIEPASVPQVPTNSDQPSRPSSTFPAKAHYSSPTTAGLDPASKRWPKKKDDGTALQDSRRSRWPKQNHNMTVLDKPL